MRRFGAILIFIMTLCLLAPLGARAQEFMLPNRDAKRLNDEALKEYRRGLWHLDHIDYTGALDYYIQAQRKDEGHVELRFLVARLATAESIKRMGGEAVDLLEKAKTAYKEILEMSEKGYGIRKSELRRATIAIKQIEDTIENQEKLDQARRVAAKKIFQKFIEETGRRSKEKDKEKNKEEESA
ncbi:hypothetical protein HQ520_05160 [bacterium]|nr:hypothetical protein [bacterium]